MLDPIHNQGLRLALGTFRTSPVASLYVEADEPSLYARREKLSLQWGDFAQVRNNCFHVDNMKELFQDIHIDSIMTF